MDTPNEKPSVYRIADIEYSNSQFDERIVGIFRFESSGSPKRGPILLVLAEIDGVGYVYDQLIDVVNNEAEHSRNLTSSVEQDPVTRFEKVVQNVNDAVKEFVKQETAPINWTRVNMFLLELSDGHLCLAGIGRLMNMFLQAQQDGTYKTYDLFGSLDQPADINPEKMFSNIICGDFRCGDLLIAGSKNFERFRNELRLKERLTTLPPVTAALEIKQDLDAHGVPDDFVAAVVACLPADEPKQMPLPVVPEKEKSTASIENLRRTEADALRYLAPTFGKKDETNTGAAGPAVPKMAGARFNPLALLGRIFTRKPKRNVADMVNLRGMHAGFGTFFTKKKKTMVVGAIALVLAVVLIGVYVKHRQNVMAQETAWNAAYDTAKEAIGRAEGESVYSEDQARATLTQALASLNNLNAGTASRKDAIAKLQSQAADLKKKLQRIQNVDAPTQLFALPDGIAPGALSSPILYQNRIVFLDRADKQLVAVDPTTKAAKKIDLPAGTAAPVAIGAGKSSVIILLEDKSLLSTTIDDGKVAKSSIGSSDEKAVTDAVVYVNRLYALDATNQQIWKYASASGGFGNGAKYLQATNSNLSNAVSLSIDSSIYVLSSNGNVARFMSGGQDGFALATIDPPLSNANQIWTDIDAPDVAIADQTGKRVAVFTKDGKLVGQYVSPAFQGPVDLTGDPKTKNLYVVDSSNKVYVLPLP